MVKAALFDLDGTLLNSLDDIADSANLALERYKLPQKSKSEIQDCIGDGVIKLIERIMPESSDSNLTKEALQLYRSFYAKKKFNKTKPYDGVTDMLERLWKAGVKIAVVTNKAEAAAIEIINNYFPNLIDITVGDDFVRPLKPDPSSIIHALKQIGCAPSEAVFVGDTEMDIKAAKNARVCSIGVTWGYRDKETLAIHKPDFLADNVCELLEYIIK